MKGKKPTATDLISDDSFIEWIRDPNSKQGNWAEREGQDPELKATINEARGLLSSMRFKYETLKPAEKHIMREKLIESIDTLPIEKKFVVTSWWKAAAVLLLLIVSSLLFLLSRYNDNEAVYTTKFGETRKIVLADGSTVVLNGNSEVRTKADFSKEENRDVYLKGEAFFSVIHTKDDKKFIVHAEDGFDVEVLGTEFNVTKRNEISRVVLSSGRIRLNLKENEIRNNPSKIEMEPGDMLEYREKQSSYEKRKVDPELYSSWRNNKLILHKTSLLDLTQMLESTYGLEVEVMEKGLYKLQVSGSMPLENAEDLIENIQDLFDVRIQRDGKKLKLYSKK